MHRVVVALSLAACALLAAAQPKSDWERRNEGRLASPDKPVLPAYPNARDLIEFYVGPTVDFRYFVDGRSIAIGSDSIVRYTLVARSPSGVENVTFEAIRCPDQFRVYAVGHSDGSWSGRTGDWRGIERGSAVNWRYALARNFFCPHRDPIRSAEEGLDALRAGGHPTVRVDDSPH